MKHSRHDGRKPDQLRPFTLKRRYTCSAAGSVLVQAGGTVVLVTASIEKSVPPFLRGQGKGWITAEYGMLPGSTAPRKARDRSGKVDGRTIEIQRLIGRSLRQAVDLTAMGEITLTIDCDVLQADGGTRTASITGGFVALVDALAAHRKVVPLVREPIVRSIVAVSAGVVGGKAVLDLDYVEDSTAEVDMNVVMTGDGAFVEVQGTGEGSPFDDAHLADLIKVSKRGCEALTEIQRKALGRAWPFKS